MSEKKENQSGKGECRLPDHKLTLDEAIAHAEECADNTPCGSQHRQLADWLKELKRLKTSVPCGNTAAMRNALEAIKDEAVRISETYTAPMVHLTSLAIDALSDPPRNCDVGTAEEKKERFKHFCRLHPNCLGCVMKGRHFCRWECALAWMQTPYKEGEDNGSV